MTLNPHIETLKRAKAYLDDAIAALENFLKQQEKSEGRRASDEAESLVKERQPITDQALRPARQPRRPRKGKSGTQLEEVNRG